MKHDNFVYDDADPKKIDDRFIFDDNGIYKIEQSPLDKKFRIYEKGQLKKECNTYAECVIFLEEKEVFNVKGEFGENCMNWYTDAKSNIQKLGETHSLPLVFAELEKELIKDS